MRLLPTVRGRIMPAVMLVGLASGWLPFVLDESSARASNPSSPGVQEQSDGLMKSVEEMLAHGGMGDAKAIVHHCGEAMRYAEGLIKQLSASDPVPNDAITPLNEVVRQCRRVLDIGIHADPGQLLNPAIKARTAAKESMKLIRANRN